MEDEQILQGNKIEPLGQETIPLEPIFKPDPPITEAPQLDTEMITNQARARSMSDFGLGSGSMSVLTPGAGRIKPQSMLSPAYFQTLSDGTRITRQEVFNPALSPQRNEELLASSQTGGAMFGRALARLGGQTGINVLGGTAGTVYGMFQAVKEGSLEAFYNNDFSRYLEDLRKRNDLSNRIYTPKGYDDLNFFQKMGTGKFYADELTGGLSFLAGTIISEGIWAAATGGTGLIAKGALGGVGRMAQKAMVNKKLPGVLSKAKSEGKDLLAKSWKGKIDDPLIAKTIQDATIRAGNIQSAFNKTRFTLTSAGYESSVEALGYLEEAQNAYVARMRDQEGRDPTPEEMGALRAGLLDGSNSVFFSNMALVGFSNHVILGKMLLGRNTAQKVSNTWFKKNMLGIGSRKLKDGTRKALEAKKWQKNFRRAYGFGKPMFTEGVVEEGGQAVISKSIQDYVMSGYDADRTNDNLSLIEAIQAGIEETYTSKEGLTEVGLGALIGILGGGMSTGFRFNEYGREADALEKTIEFTNQRTNQHLLNSMVASNKVTQAVMNAKTAEEKGNMTDAVTYDASAITAVVERELIYNDVDTVIKEFNAHIEHADSQAIANETGMTVEEVNEWKKLKSREFDKVARTHARNLQFAEALVGDTNVAGLNKLDVFEEGQNAKLHLQTAIAYAMTMGVQADDFAQSIASQIQQVVARDVTGQAYSAIMVNERLRNISKTLKDRFTQVSNEKATLERQKTELENKIQERQVQPDTGETNQKAKQLADLARQLEEVNAKINNAEAQKQLVLDTINIETQDGAPLTVEQLDNQQKNVEVLENRARNMMLTDPDAHIALQELTAEYSRAVEKAEGFQTVVKMVMDPKTRVSMLNGWASSLINKNKKVNEAAGQYFTDLVVKYHKDAIRTRVKGEEEYLDRIQNEDPDKDDPTDPNEPPTTDPTQTPPDNPVADMEAAPDARQEPKERGVTAAEKIRAKVDDTVKSDVYAKTRFVGVDRKAKDVIPTRKDVETYNELLGKAQEVPSEEELVNNEPVAREKMALEEDEFQDFKALNTKLNNWEILSGIEADDSSIAQLLLLAQQIQDGVVANNTADNVPVDHFFIPGTISEKKGNQNHKGLDGIISPDLSAAKKKKDGTTEIVHTKPTSLPQMFPGTDLLVVIDGRPVRVSTMTGTEQLKKLSELSSQAGTVFLLENREAGPNSRVKFTLDDRQRLVVDTEALIGLMEEGTTQVLDFGNSNYLPIYQRNEDGSYSPRDGDFIIETTTDNEIVTLDKFALYGVAPGTHVRTVVNKNDAYNAMLFEKLEKGEMTETEVANEMVIYLALEGAANDIVGVLRAVKPTTNGNAGNFAEVSVLRRLAFQRMQKSTNSKVEVGITIPIRTVRAGTLNVNVVEQNGRLVPESLPLNVESLNAVVDYGYIQDGTAQTQGNMELKPNELLFAKKASEQAANKGKKVPFVVVNFKGRNVAIPVSLVEQNARGVADIQEMLMGDEFSNAEKIFKINEIAREVGIDFRDYNITDVVEDVDEVNRLLSEIANTKIRPNVDNWIQPGHDKAALMQEARTPVDLTGQVLAGAKGMLAMKEMALPTEEDMKREQVNLLSDMLIRVENRFRETEPFAETGDQTQFFEAMYGDESLIAEPKNFLERSRNKNIIVNAFSKSIPKTVNQALGGEFIDQIKKEVKLFKLLDQGINPNEKIQKEMQNEINQLKSEQECK